MDLVYRVDIGRDSLWEGTSLFDNDDFQCFQSRYNYVRDLQRWD